MKTLILRILDWLPNFPGIYIPKWIGPVSRGNTALFYDTNSLELGETTDTLQAVTMKRDVPIHSAIIIYQFQPFRRIV